MKENKKKTSREKKVLIGALSLAAVTMASSTFAWFTSKDEVTNRLSANADYNVRIVESFAAPNNWLPGNVTNKDVYATNTGNIPAFVKEEVSGVLTITTEKETADLTDKSVKLTPEEVYVMEAGAYLAYKPGTDTENTLGDQIVMVTQEVDSDNPERFETKTDFTPVSEGLYVFRRTIVVGNDRTEKFTYEGYYYKDGEYYKISNLKTTPDGNADLADDGEKSDGQITSATAGFYEEEQSVINPVNLEYDSDNNRLVATYSTGSKDYASDAVKNAAEELDRANHEYELAKELFEKAKADNLDSSSGVGDAKKDLDDAKKDLDTAQEERDDALLARDKAKAESYNADKLYESLNEQVTDSENKITVLKTAKTVAETALNSATEDSREAFEKEYPNYSSMSYEALLLDPPSNEAHDYYEKFIALKIAERDLANEESRKSELEIKRSSAYSDKDYKNDALTNAEKELGDKDTALTNAKSAYDNALTAYKNALSADDNENATLIDATNRYQAAIKAKADAETVYQALVDVTNENAIEDADTDILTIYINLSDDVTLTGGVADKWQMLPTTVENKTAVFYYTGILLGSETSSKLIDSVELADTVTTDMYKSFDFDLNIALDSVQITYDEDNETILTTGATDELKAKATLTDPKNLETAVNWTIS